MAKALRDDWDSEGRGDGPEALSWNMAKVGTVFTGIAVPPEPLTAPTKGYRVAQRNGKSSLDKSTDAPKGPLFWRPKTMEKGGPIFADEYLRNGGRDEDMEPVPMKVVTCVTDYREKEFFSMPAEARAAEADNFVDTGLRNVFVDGIDIPGKFDEALKVAGMKRGLPAGARISIRLDARTPNKSGEGHQRVHSVKIETPTPETLKVVDAYIAEAKAGASSAGVQDDWAKSGEEPPF